MRVRAAKCVFAHSLFRCQLQDDLSGVLALQAQAKVLLCLRAPLWSLHSLEPSGCISSSPMHVKGPYGAHLVLGKG